MQTPPLKFTTLVPKTWTLLEALPRTGWVMWNVPNPETVAEHTIALRKLACKLQPKLQLSETDFEKLLDILEIHDWGESITGDIATDSYSVAEQKKLIEQKKDNELEAMRTICIPLGNTGSHIIDLYREMENQTTPLSHIAHHIDKIQADIQAVEYEVQYGIKGLAWEFLQYDKDTYTIPLFKDIYQDLLSHPHIYRDFTR